MKDVAKKKPVGEERRSLVLDLGLVVRQDLREFVVGVGLAALEALLEEDRTSLCGARYEHKPDRRFGRAGHTDGELVMGGRKVGVRRPRVVSREGREVALPSWSAFRDADPLDDRVLAQMMLGVSTRRYAPSLEATPPEVRSRGTSKSAVSRRFVAKTGKMLEEWMHRPLGDIPLCVLMLDGIHLDEHVFLVALGIDVEGKKHVLGVREGATENATACRALLADLRERGMPTESPLLIVLDGGKALFRAVRDVFGERARIQRCQVHKMRNVLDHLPDGKKASVRAAMRQAYKATDPDRARKQLVAIAGRLRAEEPSAAGSIEEGLDESLTVKRLKLPSSLERILSTTNAIENLMGSVRDRTKRVKSWRSGDMRLRWVGAALQDASKRFRRVAGASGLKALVAALRSPAVAVSTKAA